MTNPWTQSTLTEHQREARQDEDESQVEIDSEDEEECRTLKAEARMAAIRKGKSWTEIV